MTVKQKQCLLYYLGYYDGSIDGAWGEKSQAATKKFQKDYGLSADGVFGSATEKKILSVVASGEAPKTSQVGDWWDEIEYFTPGEFACKCGCGACEMKEAVVRVADRVRKHFDSPARVSSGRRCKTHNAAVGGVSNSRHLEGKAIDFAITGKSASQVLSYVKQQPEIRYAYAIDGSYVHMDIE